MERELGREVTDAEVARELDITEEQLLDRMRYAQDTISYNVGVGEEGDTELMDLIGVNEVDYAGSIFDKDLEALLQKGLRALGEKDAKSAEVLRMRFGFFEDATPSYAEIGRRIGMTGSGVILVEKRAMRTLRELLESDPRVHLLDELFGKEEQGAA